MDETNNGVKAPSIKLDNITESTGESYKTPNYKPAIHEENYKDMNYSKFDMKRHKISPVLEWSIIASAILIIILGVTFIFINNNGVKNCGLDSGCFIEQANLCEPAELEMYYVDDTVVTFKSNKQCILEKEITNFNENEPELVVDLLSEKKMTCPYEKNNFNSFVVYDLVNGIDECEGDLKEAILELLVYAEIAELEDE